MASQAIWPLTSCLPILFFTFLPLFSAPVTLFYYLFFKHTQHSFPRTFTLYSVSIQSSVPDNHMVSFLVSLGKLLKSETIPTHPDRKHPTPALYHWTMTLLSLVIYCRSIELITPDMLLTCLFCILFVPPTHPMEGWDWFTFKNIWSFKNYGV